MKKVTLDKVNFILENCEIVEVDREYITINIVEKERCLTNGYANGRSEIDEYPVCEFQAIISDPKTSMKVETFVDEAQDGTERVKYKDITGIELVLSDGSTRHWYVQWSKKANDYYDQKIKLKEIKDTNWRKNKLVETPCLIIESAGWRQCD